DLARENFIVKSLEMSFGSGRVKGLQVGPYTLRGEIDRLDLLRGDVSKTGWVEGYFVTDYKRSGTSIDTAKATNRFQIKAYMLAIKNLGFSPVLGGKFHALTGETDYRCSLWADEILGRRSRLKLSIEEFEKELEGELQRAKNAAERLYGGVYTPNYESKSCRYCSFMALCQKPSRAEDAGDDNGD
ncbi:MAG TPA: PD-(D/E)XK nuclease family protein, partial [Bacillota bacterium]|nr:PD-(D/E)XK nuclease family protein [Bacillota bacterium]